ncbi:MAG: GntR family transcriptional regulator [Firmicutes bacterium]|nr:GntR family transcriptional regulator [Bacillota bacterium]
MFQIELKSRKAIYEQVIDNFKRLIITGVIAQDEKVPSVRDLAQLLTVNPNTVQKAYRILETQGYFYTVPGKGNFIAVPPAAENQKDISKIYSQLTSHVQELLYRGETADNIVNFVENLTKNQITKGED